MEFSTTFSFTRKEYILFKYALIFKRKNSRLLVLVGIAMTLLVYIFADYNPDIYKNTLISIVLNCLYIFEGILILLLLLYGMLLTWLFGRLKNNIKTIYSDEEIRAENPDRSVVSVLKWNTMTRIREARNIYELYFKGLGYLYIHKADITPGQLQFIQKKSGIEKIEQSK